MDTREKIVPVARLSQILSRGDWIVVAGLFDPLTAVQAARLAELHRNGGRLAVVIETNSASLLPAGARAALIAALRHVEVVAIATEDWRAEIPENVQLVRDAEAERARSDEFVQFVLRRQTGAAR